MKTLNPNILDIKDLFVNYRTFGGERKVLNGVNIFVKKGEKVSIVGETGCGKTTTVKSVLQILPRQGRITRGQIIFDGSDVLKMTEAEINKLRSSGASMIFQDPTMSLNPVFTIGEQMDAVIRHSGQPGVDDKSVRHELAVKALEETAMPDPERILENYPFQLSGGMRQRVSIAMALATPRQLVIADEPTTNLDVTVEAQVLRILRERVEAKGSSLVLITHSFGVARETTDRIYVMYAGNMVETAPTADLFREQLHPYSQALMACIPKITGGGVAEGIPGRLPSYIDPPRGCRFAPRCSSAMPKCHELTPGFVRVGEERGVACFLYGEEREIA